MAPITPPTTPPPTAPVAAVAAEEDSPAPSRASSSTGLRLTKPICASVNPARRNSSTAASA
ncbi:MAG TPA: hypothetical protein VKY19_27255 [Ktedonosporobacter sp.]|nr:hypothetical protein [Ktedonosporobacter sp.]